MQEGENMSKFDMVSEFYITPNENDFALTGICGVGYNDFHFVKPIKHLHTMYYPSLHFILSGEGTYRIGNASYDLHAGQMFLVLDGCPMCYYPKEGKEWRYVWFSFYSKKLYSFLDTVGINENNLIANVKDPKKTEELLLKIFEMDNRRGNTAFAALSLFFEVLALERTEPFEREGRKQHYVSVVKKYLEDNYSRPDLKIEILCERIHLSHSYISRIFREFEGCSIMNYLEDIRMERACFLLTTTDFSVSRVGYSVGYNDILHFMKRFKRKYGMTCVEYRQEKKILKI